MKAIPFSIISAFVFGIYTFGCLKFDRPFWALTSACIGLLAAVYPLYFERQRLDAIRHAQVAQYLAEAGPRPENALFRRYLDSIKAQLTDVRAHRLALSREQFSSYLEDRLSARQADRSPAKYWVTHIVESDEGARVWRQSKGSHTFLSGYVDLQCALLNAGGDVIRIFLFSESYVRSRLADCEVMIAAHDELFSVARRPITTLAGFLPDELMPRHEISLLDCEELFTYDPAGGLEPSRSTYRRGTYSIAASDVKEELANWRRYHGSAVAPDRFFQIVRDNASL